MKPYILEGIWSSAPLKMYGFLKQGVSNEYTSISAYFQGAHFTKCPLEFLIHDKIHFKGAVVQNIDLK